MEKYIINFEDGQNYLADVITPDDIKAMQNGIISIVRSSDLKTMTLGGTWIDLPKWTN